MDEKKFEVGQKWRTREGNIVTVEDVVPSVEWPIFASDDFTRHENGALFRDRPCGLDLVELIDDETPAQYSAGIPTDFGMVEMHAADQRAIDSLLDKMNRQQETADTTRQEFIGTLIVNAAVNGYTPEYIKRYIELYDHF